MGLWTPAVTKKVGTGGRIESACLKEQGRWNDSKQMENCRLNHQQFTTWTPRTKPRAGV